MDYYNYFFKQLFFVFLITLIIGTIQSCVKKQMSVKEAKQVAISMGDRSYAAPPRRIDDLLEYCEQIGQQQNITRRKLGDGIEQPPPQTKNDAILARYYQKKGSDALLKGRYNQARVNFLLAYNHSGTNYSYKLLNRLAIAEYTCGNYLRSIELFKKALSRKRNPAYYTSLVRNYSLVGDLESAQKYANRGISFCNEIRQIPAWKNWPIVEAASMKAWVLEAQGKFSEAEPYRRDAVRYFSKSMQKKYTITYIALKAYLSRNLTSQNRLVEAEVIIREVIKELMVLDKNSDAIAQGVHDLGIIFLKQGRLDDAENLMRAGQRLFKNLNTPPDSYYLALSKVRFIEVLSAAQKFDEAVEQFDIVKLSMKQNRYLYENYFVRNPALILSLLRTGRVEEAKNLHSALFVQNKKLFGEDHYLTGESLGLQGMIHLLQKNDKQAFLDFHQAFSVLIKTSSGSTISIDKGIRLKNILESYLGLLARVKGSELEKVVGIDATSEAFRLADYLNRSTVSSAIGASIARSAVTSPQLKDLVRKAHDIQSQLKVLEEALVANVVAPQEQRFQGLIEELKTKIVTLTRAHKVLMDEINTTYPKYAEFTSPMPVNISSLQRYLHTGEVFVIIYSACGQSYIWAVPFEGKAEFESVPIGRSELSQIVTDLRRAIDSKPLILGDIPEFDTSTAYSLYRMLFEPVNSSLQNAQDLLIVAHGPLGQLPFALLPTTLANPVRKQELFSEYRKIPWLIRKVSITRLPSASTLVQLRGVTLSDSKRRMFAGFGDPLFNPQQLAEAQKERKEKGTLLAIPKWQLSVRGIRVADVGDLDNNKIVSCTLDQLNRLPDTATEIKYIANALDASLSTDVFLGQHASELQVKSMDLSDRRVIAFATHALVPGDLDGLDQPAIALSAPSVAGPNEDGLLTMSEILQLKLNADWVVLSACNTGAAKGRGSEAISGLGQAFFYAGTRAILVSMWPVETTSARKLTTRLFEYQKEDKTLSRARALKKSALSLIDAEGFKDGDSGKIIASYAHPLFWAPFVIVGDGRL